MAASTGPAENNTIPVQTVQLGDNFNLWLDVTNTAINKINKLKVYDFVDSTSISGTLAAGGTLSVSLSDNVNKGLTFQQPVLFSSGVTFNVNVTFNSGMVTLNANIVTIDDYNIVLGDTAEASDGKINTAGGGGILLNRGSGGTAEWLWQTTQVHGITGVWRANTHIGFSGATSGIYPHNGGSLRVHGSGVQIDGGSTSDHGVLINLTSTGLAGTTSGRTIEFTRYAPTGSTAFIQVLNGSTYGSQPFVNIPSGANRKVVTQSNHLFVFGQPLYLNGSVYTIAKGDSANTAEVVGLVSRVIDTNNFEITFLGEIFGNFSSITEGGAALTPGSVYYLSPYSAGRITPTQPQAAAQVHKAVLIATSATSGIVYPFTGGVLSSPVNIATANSVGTIFTQLNQFKIGDFVRWDGASRGVTYIGTDGLTYAYVYSNGAYVKAQANSAEEAELAGMVISTTDAAAIGTSGVNSSFTLLMDGFFSGLSLPASYGTPQNGTVYFLAKDCVGSTPYSCLESSTPSIAVNYPTQAGTVRKPLLMSTSSSAGNWSGYLFSYRGDVTDVQGLSAGARLEDLLVQNLGSCGSAADLKFGVNIGTNIAGGQQVMRLPFRRPGSVDIGYSSNGLNGASLDVKGVIRGGRATATQGGDILVGRASSDSTDSTYPTTLNVFGSQFSSANTVLSYGMRPRSGVAGYESTWAESSPPRAALEVGYTGSSYPGLALYTVAANNNAVGTAYTPTELLTVNTNSMVYNGGNLGIGTVSPTAKLHIFNALDESIRMEGSSSVNSPYMSLYRGGVRKGYIQHSGTDLILRTEDASGAVKLLNSTSEVLRADSTGVVTIPSTTSSTSTGTGALTVGGGLGVAGALNVGGGITAATLDVSGGIKLTSGGFNTSTFVNITDTASSTSTGTGALIVAGGVGVAKTIVAAGITSTAGLSVTGTVSLPSNSVSLASVAQIATATILGNSTGSSGNVTALSAATVKTLLGLGNYASLLNTEVGGIAIVAYTVTNASTITINYQYPASTFAVKTGAGDNKLGSVAGTWNGVYIVNESSSGALVAATTHAASSAAFTHTASPSTYRGIAIAFRTA